MNPASDPNDKLEQFVQRALSDLPARRAPSTLEDRVLFEIERRAAMRWWKKSVVEWPFGARLAFVAGSAAVAAIMVVAAMWVLAGFDPSSVREAIAPQLAWLGGLATAGRALADFLALTLRTIPPLWLYGGIAIVAALYASLFGLGAAAYRTLYARH